jgi:hypothetical protein
MYSIEGSNINIEAMRLVFEKLPEQEVLPILAVEFEFVFHKHVSAAYSSWLKFIAIFRSWIMPNFIDGIILTQLLLGKRREA